MRSLVFLVFSIFLFSNSAAAQQDLSSYSYVLVPQKFEFQKERNQYRFNTLMRHLFKEAGFNPIYEEEQQGLPRCEGLYAEVIPVSNFTYIKTTVVLKDCNDNIVYHSQEGSSKSKDYQEGYHEALRESFRNIYALQVKQKDLEELRNRTLLPTKSSKSSSAANKIKESHDEDYGKRYSFQGETYYLREAGKEFILFRKSTVNDRLVEEVGKLMPSSREGIYFFSAKERNALATFDAEGNLSIEISDGDGNISQQVFRLEK